MAGPSVDLVLLRGLLPEVPLRPGSFVTGRVLDVRTLVLEGVRMQAQLPPDVHPGQRLRMRVEQAGSDRLHLRIVAELTDAATGTARSEGAQSSQAQQSSQVPVQAYAMALPGGVEARVYVTEDGEDADSGDGGAGRPVVLRYDSPSLGRLDIRLDRNSAAIHAPIGEPAERVRGALAELQSALTGVLGSDVQVTLHPRPQTYDARA